MATTKKSTSVKATTNNVKASKDATTLENAKKAIFDVNNAKETTKESNIYRYAHLDEDRALTDNERNSDKFMKTYRRNLRARLQKHLDLFSEIKKQMQVKNVSLKATIAEIKEQNYFSDFLTFYKRFYKINDFSATSVSNNQRLPKIAEAMQIIQTFAIAIEKEK